MKFTESFRNQKPLIGMIHTDGTDENTTLGMDMWIQDMNGTIF